AMLCAELIWMQLSHLNFLATLRLSSITASYSNAPNHFSQLNFLGSSHLLPSGKNNSVTTNGIGLVARKALLRNELLNDAIDDARFISCNVNTGPVLDCSNARLFKFGRNMATKPGDLSAGNANRCLFRGPLSDESRRFLISLEKSQRKIPEKPYKILDINLMQDDFYVNLVDWSARNILAVGLDTTVSLLKRDNEQIMLCDLQAEHDFVTSVQWNRMGDLLAVGTERGRTRIWDMRVAKKVHEFFGHASKVGCLAWNASLISSGSQDCLIIHWDIRQPAKSAEQRFNGHSGEYMVFCPQSKHCWVQVCGLKWSSNGEYLASGGNDNQLLVWNLRKNKPLQVHTKHIAAVRALAWSPHRRGLLVSGGGTADCRLRFWDVLTGQQLQSVLTGSQVCNVAWSRHSCELVSTHGFMDNKVIVWKYPSLEPLAVLKGHERRVLFLAMSPDGESIVTGAGDGTLRFWRIFGQSLQQKVARSKLDLSSSIR
uniref:Anaphase-promoting complex subunit 4-like WD40 domain-containing protein n=1 Tax=Parascaris univalens TaxID=6257 RepID=A0A914ZVX5_PARUN